MDLTKQLLAKINTFDLPTRVFSTALKGKQDPEIGLLVLPNSQVINQDLAGNRVEDFLYEVTMRSRDEGLTNETLWKIAEKIGDDDFTVKSADSSFIFDKATVNSFPTMTAVDVSGNVTYIFDFTVEVETFNN